MKIIMCKKIHHLIFLIQINIQVNKREIFPTIYSETFNSLIANGSQFYRIVSRVLAEILYFSGSYIEAPKKVKINFEKRQKSQPYFSTVR